MEARVRSACMQCVLSFCVCLSDCECWVVREEERTALRERIERLEAESRDKGWALSSQQFEKMVPMHIQRLCVCACGL